jgi:murein DD-endopeptidase MepM/ murein hydrolase activator NlpD
MKTKLLPIMGMLAFNLVTYPQSSMIERNREILLEMQTEIQKVVREIRGSIDQMGFIEDLTSDDQGNTIENTITAENLIVNENNTDEYYPDIYPVSEKPRVSSGYGYRIDPFNSKKAFHSGIDLAVLKDTEVLSCGAGKVVRASYNRINGNYIIIDHGNKYKSCYGHLSKVSVKCGDRVIKGQVIGLSGSTGMSTGPHIHYQVIYDGKTIDPLTIIN